MRLLQNSKLRKSLLGLSLITIFIAGKFLNDYLEKNGFKRLYEQFIDTYLSDNIEKENKTPLDLQNQIR